MLDQAPSPSVKEYCAGKMSRRRFLHLGIKTTLIGSAMSFLLSKSSANPASEASGATWEIVLLDGYPYPKSFRKYAARARFSSADEALDKIRSRRYPVEIKITSP
jgi:hypothetical protein